MPTGEPTARPRRRRHRVLLLLCAFVLALGAAEATLRFLGRQPGYSPRYGKGALWPGQRLVVLDSFFTDDHGVFKANAHAVWNDPTIAVNSEGFRGPEFEPAPPGVSSVLFLGDSFTWGAAAQPITESFVDRVAAAGYRCFNTGIPGTDPGQYAVLAEQYVPQLHPDHVFVMLYLGNDIQELQPMRPGKDLYFTTNAGLLLAFDPEGHYLGSAENAFERYLRLSNRVGDDDRGPFLDTVRAIMTTTALGTELWAALAEHAPPRLSERGDWSERRKRLAGPVRDCLERIHRVAEANDADDRLFFIPTSPALPQGKHGPQEDVPLFQSFDPIVPDDLSAADYDAEHGNHLNNDGHGKLADLILRVLSQS